MTIALEDRALSESDDATAERSVVTSDYFVTMQARMVAGRPIDDTDRPGSESVVVINEAFARRFWPGKDPIGRRIDAGRGWTTVVGVVQDGRYANLVDRLRALVPTGVTAAIDLYGTETAQAARELGVPDERITTIAARIDGITPVNGANAAPGAIEEIARLVAAGQLRVPIAARFPVEQIRAAVELQAGRHVHGKVVIDL